MKTNLLPLLSAQLFPRLLALYAGLLSILPVPALAEFWLAGSPMPGARASHSAVWTGREMIVWGGGIDGNFLNTGGRYLPSTDTWRPTSSDGAPAPRWFHAAVWTGREMIVWGGRASFDGIANYNDGARYNPDTDTWRPMSGQGAPNPRSQCAAVWTGRELLIWGGATDGGIEVNDGARYDPETDTWTPISNSSGLEPRMEPSAVWTGSELIVFGGMRFTGGELSFGNGARYRPITDTWSPLPVAYSMPSRTGHTAVWTGERMIVWGGRTVPQQTLHNSGAIFDLGSNQWTPVAGDPYLPGRMYHAAVWTGAEMLVWGGQDIDGNMLNSGARFRPSTGLWTATATDGAAGKRQFWRPDLGVWTGEAMLIAGGSDYPASLDSTYLYFPEGTPPPPSAVFDLSRDFSPSSNPAGAWSYGYLPTLDGPFARLTFAKTFGAENGVPIAAWQVSDAFSPSVNRVMGEGTAVSEGGAFTAPAGTVYVWPGNYGSPGKFGVIRFTVPSGGAGPYLLQTAVRPTFDGPTARDTDFHVQRNGQELFGQFLAPGAGTTYSNLLALVEGDTVDLVVGPGADGETDHSSLKVQATLTRQTNAPPANCIPAPAGLVGWWRGEGNADDTLGHGSGQANGGVTYEPGVVGQAFRVDGVQGRISVPDADEFKLVDALTIEAWVKLINRDSGLSIIMRGDDRPGLDPYFMGVDQGRITFGISDNTDSDYIAAPLPMGQWKHVAGTFDSAGGALKLYLDGALAAEKQTSRRPARELDPQSSPGLGIGNVNGSWINFPWDGWLDEVSLYNRALSAEEVRAIHQAGAAGKCASTNPPPPPVAVFDLSRDFSPSSNPAGAWSYGYLATLDGQLTPFTFTTSFNSENGVPISSWAVANGLAPGIARVMGDRTAISAGGAFTAPPGAVWLAPGNDGSPGIFGVARFTVPPGSGGLYRLESAVRSNFEGPISADGEFHVLNNGHEVFNHFLPPNSSSGYSNTLELVAGQTIDFVVGRGEDGLEPHSSLRIQAMLALVTNAPPPPPTNCVAAPLGVVAWWRAEGDANDTTGTHAGELLYGAAFAPGRVGQAFSFDGVRSRVSIPDSAAFRLTNSLSFEGWIRPASLAPGIIFFRGDNRPGLDPYHMSVSTSGHLHWGINNAANESAAVDSPEVLPIGVWLHVAGVLNGATGDLGLYMNGSLVSHTTTSIRPMRDLDPASEPNLGIGNHGGTFHNFPFHGLVDEWTLYSRPLSTEDISRIYRAGAAGKCSSTNPPPPPPPPSAVFDLSAQFSLDANPNGPWSYGYLATLDGQLTPFTFTTSFNSENGVPISEWAVANGLAPGIARVMGDRTAISAGGAFTAPPGDVWLTPGNDGSPGVFGVARFTVPPGSGGLYRLESAVHSNFEGPLSADGEFHVLNNGNEVFSHFLPPNSSSGYSNTMELVAGQTIDFVVGRGADGLEPNSSLRIQATLALATNAPPPPPPPIDCVPAPSSMVAWWRGEGDAQDALGRHPGTLVGNVTFAPGMVGQGFQFDGSGGYVRIPHHDAFDFTSELTIELWYKHEGLPDEAYGLVSTRGTEVGPVNYAISVIPIGIGPYFNDPTVATGDDVDHGGTFEASRYLPVPSSGVFHHLGVTFRQAGTNQVELKTFIDGRLVRTKTLVARLGNAVNDAAIVIGRSAEYGGEFFHGVIDEVAIYRRALTADEMSAIARAGGHGKCLVSTAPFLEPLLALVTGAPASVSQEPLRRMLEAVTVSLARGNVRAAIRQLQRFQSQCRLGVAPVAPDLARQLQALAQRFIESLDPSGARREELAALDQTPYRVLRLFRLPERGLGVESCAPPGAVCSVQRSTNLRDWVDASPPVEVSDGIQHCVDSQPEGAACFYRLIVRSED